MASEELSKAEVIHTVKVDSTMLRCRWVPDDEVINCTGCHLLFTTVFRKHHCRKCGGVFCDQCSSLRALIPRNLMLFPPHKESFASIPGFSPENASNEPQRVCATCFESLKDEQPGLRNLVSKAYKETYVSRESLGRYLNSPYVMTLESEIKKACYTLINFTTDLKIGKDLPKELLWNAKGFAFLTIIKAGFFLSGRMGTGLVIRKLDDGAWSAPCAIGTTGTGWGLQIGGEITDLMIILNTDKAVDVFTSETQVSVGTALGLSVGPIGRAVGTDVHAGAGGLSPATFYAHSKGLFAGVSLEASVIASRPSVNSAFYGETVSSVTLLGGSYPRPIAAEPLYKLLKEVTNPASSAASQGISGSNDNMREV
eukprot:gene11976-25081_t